MSYINYDPTAQAWYTRKRYILPLGALGLLMLLVLFVAYARNTPSTTSGEVSGVETGKVDMPFDDCNDHIRTVGDRFGVTPINIVDSSAMRMVRLPTRDGSIIITCSAIDDTMLVTTSDSRG